MVKGEKMRHMGWDAAGEPLTLARNEDCEVSQDRQGFHGGHRPEDSKRILDSSLIDLKGLP